MIAIIPAAIINPAGNPFVNSTATRVPIKTPNNIVGFIGKIPTPFPPMYDTVKPARMDPKPIGEAINFITFSLVIFPDVIGIKRKSMRKKIPIGKEYC